MIVKLLQIFCILVLSNIIFCSSSTQFKDASDDSARIIGGTEVEPGSIPYIVAIFMNTTDHGVRFHCGGTLVSRQHVVTAAHCVQGWHPDRFYTVIGAHNLSHPDGSEKIHHVQETQVFDYFNWEDGSAIPDMDIAIITLEEAVELGPGREILPMPSTHDDPEPGTKCIVAGWGAIEEGGHIVDTLRSAEVSVIDPDYCDESYPDLITTTMMCAGWPLGGSDACAGDSGGPLVCDGIFHGIVSWGKGCGQPLNFGVYTRTVYFTEWVEKHNFVFGYPSD